MPDAAAITLFVDLDRWAERAAAYEAELLAASPEQQEAWRRGGVRAIPAAADFATGAIRPTVGETWTGRYTMSTPPVQAVPKPLRGAFVRPGRMLVTIDFHAAHLWIVADGDEQMRRDLLTADVYRLLADSLHLDGDDGRDAVKHAVLAILNGMTDDSTLVPAVRLMSLGSSVYALREQMRQRWPDAMGAFERTVEAAAARQGHDGRPLPPGKTGRRFASALVLQSAERAMLDRLIDLMASWGYELFHHVHDEAVFVVPSEHGPKQARQAALTAAAVVVGAPDLDLSQAEAIAEVAVGSGWGMDDGRRHRGNRHQPKAWLEDHHEAAAEALKMVASTKDPSLLGREEWVVAGMVAMLSPEFARYAAGIVGNERTKVGTVAYNYIPRPRKLSFDAKLRRWVKSRLEDLQARVVRDARSGMARVVLSGKDYDYLDSLAATLANQWNEERDVEGVARKAQVGEFLDTLATTADPPKMVLNELAAQSQPLPEADERLMRAWLPAMLRIDDEEVFSGGYWDDFRRWAAEVGYRWALGAVAMQYGGGQYASQVALVIQGPKGIGKTTAVRRMPPKGLDRAVVELNIGALMKHEKDAVISVYEAFIAFVDEMAELRANQVDALKRVLTMTDTMVRNPYDRSPSLRPRRWSYVMLTNGTHFTMDHALRRRLGVMPLGRVASTWTAAGRGPYYLNRDWLAQNMNRVWAATVHTYRRLAKTPHFEDHLALPPEAVDLGAPFVNEIAEDDDGSPAVILAAWLFHLAGMGVTTTELKARLLGGKFSGHAIARVRAQEGWVKTGRGRGGVNRYEPIGRCPAFSPDHFNSLLTAAELHGADLARVGDTLGLINTAIARRENPPSWLPLVHRAATAAARGSGPRVTLQG